MKVLIIGSGGREHAIAWKVAQSPKVDKIYCAPGNAGISQYAECVNIGAMEFEKLAAFAKEKEIDLTVVGMDDPDVYKRQLELFKEIRRFYIYREQLGMKAFFLNIFGNVIGFMPGGFFLPVVSRRSRRWYNTVLLCFCLSLSIETVQLIWKVGSFDVDDLFLNTLGGLIGYICYRIVQTIRIRRRKHYESAK